MLYINKKAFTLVELIVVITILAILGTIGFLSLQNYSKQTRNSARLADIGLIKKSLLLFSVTNNNYPSPDNGIIISYSGSKLWTQGNFGDNVFSEVNSLSNIPVDPLLDVKYDYSVINSGTKFQIGSIIEGGFVSYSNNKIFDQAKAVSNNDVVEYTSGNYIDYDIATFTGSYCYNVTAPSLLINSNGNNIEVGNTIQKFVYKGGVNIGDSYSGVIDVINLGSNFLITDVYNKCSLDTILDLDSYYLKLSNSYQQLNGEKKFDNIIFNSNNSSFKLYLYNKLKSDGLTINSKLLGLLIAINPENEFIDTFTGSNSQAIDTLSWTGYTIDYEINSNSLNKKNTSLSKIIFPTPNPILTLSNSKISLSIKNITGNIDIYLKYIDSNNYYLLRLNPGSYQIFQNKLGILTKLTDISQIFNIGDKINFNVFNNVLIFSINNIEKERLVASVLTGLGDIGLSINNGGDKIDNFKLLYR